MKHYLTEKRDFTKSVVELAKLRREIRGKSLTNGRHLALLHLLKVQEKLLKNKLEKAHKSVLSFQEAVVDNEARKRRLEIAYQESKINPKSKRLEQHAIETCSDIKKCGDCLSHNIDSTDGEQCGWCNGRCYDGNKNGPLVGDVCVNTYLFGASGSKCPVKETLGTHDAPSPLTIKDGMDDETLAIVKKRVAKHIATFKKSINDKYGSVVAQSKIKKDLLASSEKERLRVDKMVKDHVKNEDIMLNWNRKQGLLRLSNAVSAKLRAVRFAIAVVAKLQAQVASEKAIVEDSVSEGDEGLVDGSDDDAVVDETKLRAQYAYVGVKKLERELQVAVEKKRKLMALYVYAAKQLL